MEMTAYTTNVSTVVNLREEATMNSTTLAKLKNNTLVELLGKQGNWYKVNNNGAIGYIYGEYVAIANSSATSNSSSSSRTTSTSKATGIISSNNSSSSTTKAIPSKSSTSTSRATSSTSKTTNSNNSSSSTKVVSSKSSVSRTTSGTEGSTTSNNIVTNSDIQKGLYSNQVFEQALKEGVNSNTLAQLIFNSLNPTIKNNYNNKYNGLTLQQENIILKGTKAQKQALLNSIGNRIIINVTGDSAVPLISSTGVNERSSNYTNGTFYYNFSITTLKKLCENSNNWGQYVGLISKGGVLLSNSEINTLIENKEIYTITNGEAAYNNEYNFTNTSL